MDHSRSSLKRGPELLLLRLAKDIAIIRILFYDEDEEGGGEEGETAVAEEG